MQEAALKKKHCRIYVCQPTIISATRLRNKVAGEIGEPNYEEDGINVGLSTGPYKL